MPDPVTTLFRSVTENCAVADDSVVELFVVTPSVKVRAFCAPGDPCVATYGTYPTLFYHLNAYGAQPDLSDVLSITVSQSGGSPDLVAYTEMAKAAGALTLAVTNVAGSPVNQVVLTWREVECLAPTPSIRSTSL